MLGELRLGGKKESPPYDGRMIAKKKNTHLKGIRCDKRTWLYGKEIRLRLWRPHCFDTVGKVVNGSGELFGRK